MLDKNQTLHKREASKGGIEQLSNSVVTQKCSFFSLTAFLAFPGDSLIMYSKINHIFENDLIFEVDI